VEPRSLLLCKICTEKGTVISYFCSSKIEIKIRWTKRDRKN
jgi:hypothetical protein